MTAASASSSTPASSGRSRSSSTRRRPTRSGSCSSSRALSAAESSSSWPTRRPPITAWRWLRQRRRNRRRGRRRSRDMPRTKRKSKLRPKTPSRVKKRTKSPRQPRSLQHPELWGLGLVALGLFLGSVVYAGWNGGYVGGSLADGFHALLGAATYLLPVAFVGIGGLMVVRSALVDFPPFRTGLALVVCGLMIALGRDQGGYFGQVLGGAVGVAVGATGSTILGILLLAVGALLLSGASLGAILRGTGHQLHSRVRTRRRVKPAAAEPELETWDDRIASPPPAAVKPKRPPVDAEVAFADMIQPSPLLSTE